MKKKLLAISLATLLLLSTVLVSAEPAAEIAPCFPAAYTSIGQTPDYAAPISRASFAMLTFEAFRNINNGTFPQMEAKNIFTDIGDAPEDMFVVMLYGLGVVNGVSENSFAPRKNITRQEACTMLTRAKLRQNPDLKADISSAVSDTLALEGGAAVADWAKESVAFLYAAGILPLKDGSLAPTAELTVEEAMLLCSAFIGA